ncbi:MAG: hypothetical protein GF334_04945 [Candidatus Altiarchaeales archaeon]|nr:hypothetical protein [Candidatus Altiarchaeales archaeon]
MSIEGIHIEADTQRLDLNLSHQTLRGQFKKLHKVMQEFIHEHKNSLPKVL